MVIPLHFAAPPPDAEDPDCAAVAAALEEEILLGRLLPRERLLGEALAVRFGVSRNAVRQAEAGQLRDMESKGARVNRPNIGPFRDSVQSVYTRAREVYGAEVDAILAEAEAIRRARPAT